MAQRTERRVYRRESTYTAKLNLNLTPETYAAIARESEAEVCAMSTVARAAIAAGLPRVREANRKRRKNERKNGGKSGGKAQC